MILLCLLIRGDWLLPANQVRRLTFGFIVTLLILVVIRVLYAKIAHHLHWQHASLSMLMDKAIHLSDHFPDWERVWEIKDRPSAASPATTPRCCWSGRCSCRCSPAAPGSSC